MKKRFLFSLVAMAAMVIGTGCSNDELFNDYSQENAIGFDTYIGRGAETRATVIDNNNLPTEGFGVFAYYTGDKTFSQMATTITPNFMYNEKVTGTISGNITTWTYSPIKYWPTTNSHKISFFAYAPYDNDGPHDINGDGNTDNNDKPFRSNIELSENTDTGAPVLTYTDNADVNQQIDLLYATPVLDQTKKNQGENVEFQFKHALSRIGFSVEALIDTKNENTDGTDDGAYTEGTTDNGTSIPSGTTITVNKVVLDGNFYESGVLHLDPTEKLWSDRKGYGAFEGYVLDGDNFESENTVVTNSKKKLNNDDSYIMIIPKNFTDNGKITVELEYTIRTTDPKLALGYSEIKNTVKTEGFNFSFEAGKAYDFVLHIGLTSVQFSASVGGWIDDDSTEKDVVVNVPLVNVSSESQNNDGAEESGSQDNGENQ